ncbi:MAG: sigma-E factor negative regulatory protein [Pseudomonadales bacterium]|jgi:negative regulator of sigma E activity|nr:sigma-E factor negative regulatory protein [Pseudomonadales bacterium]
MNSSKDDLVNDLANEVPLDDPRENAARADREALSALMDDEAGDLEVRRLLRRLPEHPELLDTWKRYQFIKAALHDTPIDHEVDLWPGIEAAIADEAVPAVPRRAFSGKWLHLAGQGAIAAAVAVFALFGVSKMELGVELGQHGGSAAQPQLAGEYSPTGYERTVGLDSAARTRLQQAVYQFSSTPHSAQRPPQAAVAPLILELDLQQNKPSPTTTTFDQP